ncbi:unnamed protein product [Caenorhabditis sp. 36 PRJEB53466]|nr:unnamed protein product [Caenorhabditis sp. 36 PRJEB53466]
MSGKIDPLNNMKRYFGSLKIDEALSAPSTRVGEIGIVAYHSQNTLPFQPMIYLSNKKPAHFYMKHWEGRRLHDYSSEGFPNLIESMGIKKIVELEAMQWQEHQRIVRDLLQFLFSAYDSPKPDNKGVLWRYGGHFEEDDQRVVVYWRSALNCVVTVFSELKQSAGPPFRELITTFLHPVEQLEHLIAIKKVKEARLP